MLHHLRKSTLLLFHLLHKFQDLSTHSFALTSSGGPFLIKYRKAIAILGSHQHANQYTIGGIYVFRLFRERDEKIVDALPIHDECVVTTHTRYHLGINAREDKVGTIRIEIE
ncbi:hypothetical protein AA313_de0203255 [Arthrobotrys entomopaga]|nr:hypothetical protein AA313_de0203255 [Arthrobotrys entomopaga]